MVRSIECQVGVLAWPALMLLMIGCPVVAGFWPRVGRLSQVARVIACTCSCDGNEMSLEADPDEGCARWTCTLCRTQRFIGDSQEYWDEAAPEQLVCPECKGDTYNVAVGFSLRLGGDVKWLTIGNRCVRCGLLGSFADWKIDYSPTDHLFAKV